MTQLISGSCHCGNVRMALEWPKQVSVLPARRCGCSFCRRIDGTWTSHPNAALGLEIRQPDSVSTYRFGTGTADFLFCALCGVAFAVTCRVDDTLMAVVNVHALQLEDAEGGPISLDIRDADFEGESLEQRLKRRGDVWIRRVQYPG